MKKLLILGGTRFLGPALIRSLQASSETYDITCFHRGLHMDSLPAENVRHIIGDRRKERDVQALFAQDYDLVIDLSGTEKEMIEYAMRHALHCGRYVFVSSSSVYSPSYENPHREEEALNGGTGEPYALAKIYGEMILKERYPNYTVIRPSKVYGEGNYYFSERAFLAMLQKNPRVVLKNDPLLHFTYIDDLIAGIISLLETNGVFNIAGKEPAKLSTFITRIGRLHGIEPEFVFGETSEVKFSDLKDRTLDLSKAEKTTGWKPVVTLEEGLMRTFGIKGSGRPH